MQITWPILSHVIINSSWIVVRQWQVLTYVVYTYVIILWSQTSFIFSVIILFYLIVVTLYFIYSMSLWILVMGKQLLSMRHIEWGMCKILQDAVECLTYSRLPGSADISLVNSCVADCSLFILLNPLTTVSSVKVFPSSSINKPLKRPSCRNLFP